MFVKIKDAMAVKEKLVDRVILQLRKDIAGEKFKAGEKIPSEPELMKMYEVGRSTIREAIKTLVISGMLNVQQGSGTFVNTHMPEQTINEKLRNADFDEINAVRSLLENEMVRLAAEQHTTEQLRVVGQYLDQRKAAIHAENQQACADADIGFHIAIADASGNKVLADLYRAFSYAIRDFFNKREKHGVNYFALSHHLHEQLFQAIKARKPRQAQQVLQQILSHNY